MVYKFTALLEGDHWHVKVSSAPAENQTFAVSGHLIFRNGDDWEKFRDLLLAGPRCSGVKVIIDEAPLVGKFETYRAPS